MQYPQVQSLLHSKTVHILCNCQRILIIDILRSMAGVTLAGVTLDPAEDELLAAVDPCCCSAKVCREERGQGAAGRADAAEVRTAPRVWPRAPCPARGRPGPDPSMAPAHDLVARTTRPIRRLLAPQATLTLLHAHAVLRQLRALAHSPWRRALAETYRPCTLQRRAHVAPLARGAKGAAGLANRACL